MTQEQHEPNSIEDFEQRFNELATEARAYGIDSAIALHYSNPLDDFSQMYTFYKSSSYTALGMLKSFYETILCEIMEVKQEL